MYIQVNKTCLVSIVINGASLLFHLAWCLVTFCILVAPDMGPAHLPLSPPKSVLNNQSDNFFSQFQISMQSDIISALWRGRGIPGLQAQPWEQGSARPQGLRRPMDPPNSTHLARRAKRLSTTEVAVPKLPWTCDPILLVPSKSHPFPFYFHGVWEPTST